MALWSVAAITAVAADGPLQRRRQWGLSSRSIDEKVALIIINTPLKIRGGSDYESHGGPEKEGHDDERHLPAIEDDVDEAETETDDEWFDREFSLSKKDASARGVNYAQDVHSLAEADEDEAPTEAWDDEEEEEEEEDFADPGIEDIRTDMTEQVDNVYSKQQDVAASPEESLETREVATSFTTEAVLDNPAIDDNDSSTYVDRMDLADAYDDDVGLDTDGNTDAGDVIATSVRESAPIDEETDVKNAGDDDATTALLVEAADLYSEVDLIADDTKKVLMKELKYRKREVDAMKPEVAAVVAAKKLYRPQEGLPANWCRDGKTLSTNRERIIQILPKIVVPAIAGALAISLGPDFVSALTSKRSLVDPQIKKKLSAPSTVKHTPAVGSESSSSGRALVGEPLVPQSEPLLPVNEHTNSRGDKHPHSLKPGKVPLGDDRDELDVTWLDKLITAIDRSIKAFLRWEI